MKPEPSDKNKSGRKLLSKMFDENLEAISSAYMNGDAEKHLFVTSKTLLIINRSSIKALLPEIDKLVKVVDEEGLKPYASIAMAVAHRLARNNHKIYQSKFNKLSKVAFLHKSDEQKKSSFYVLIRKKGKENTYWQYDIESGYSISQLTLTEFGKAQFKKGQWPIDIARTAVMLWECNENEDNLGRLTPQGMKNCAQFTGIVADFLESAGQGGVPPALYGGLGNGISAQAFDCFSNDDPGSPQMIDRYEAYVACLTAEVANQPNWQIDGASISSKWWTSTTSDWNGEVPQEDGYTHQGSIEEVRFGPNGNTGTQVTHSYENEHGGTKTISDFSVRVGREGEEGFKESIGRKVIIDDGNGNTYEEIQDQDGNKIFSFRVNSDEKTIEIFEKTETGSIKTTFNMESETTTIERTENGIVTTTTIAGNGECTGDACDTSTPVDEYTWTSDCTPPWLEGSDVDELLSGDPLGPLIYPSPESGEVDELLLCIQESMSSANANNCPPSVGLCIDPPPLGSCDCFGLFSPGDFPMQSGSCQSMECGEGSRCDPATGVCISEGLDGLLGISPGIEPPQPPKPLEPWGF